MTDKKPATQLPKGMQLISDGELTEAIEWAEGQIVIGRMISLAVVPVKRGILIEDSRLMRIATEEGNVAVWESAGLKELFDMAKPGDLVYMEHTGTVDLGDGRNPMKKFITGLDPDAYNG